MAHCLISVCIFCFICATHWPCSAHSTADHLKHYHHGDLGYHNIQLSEGTLLRVKRNESHHTSNKTNHKTGNTIKKNANAKFLEQLLIKYGDGEKINVAGLEELLQKLEFMRVTSERTNSHQIEDFLAIDLRKDSEYSQRNGSCFSKEATTILQQTTEEKYLTRTAFSEACPILLYSLLDDSCLDLERNTFNISSSDKHDIDAKIWLYSSLAVVLISICGVGALVVIPLMQKRFYKPMIQFLVALAVGTLSGDALLHLFPHAMSSSHTHGHHGDEDLHLQNTWMGFVAMMGLTFFFVMERLILLAAKWRKKKQKQNNVPHVHVKIYNDQGQRRNSTQCMDKYNNSPYCYKDIMAESSNKTDIKLKNSRSSTIENSETNQNACEGELIPNPCNEEKMLRRDHEDYTVIVREHVNDHHGHSHKHGHVHSAPQSYSSVAWMVIMGDGLHNFTDGLAIGAAFAGGLAGGFSTTVAVFCHELPHELGDFAMLLKAGMSIKQALFYNLLSSGLCILGNFVGLYLGNVEAANRWVFAAAAGTFIYIALVDMIPELSSTHDDEENLIQYLLHLSGLLIGVGIMTVIALYEHDLKHLFYESE